MSNNWEDLNRLREIVNEIHLRVTNIENSLTMDKDELNMHLDAIDRRLTKLEDTSVMFKYDNPMQGKVSPEGSGQITDMPGVNDSFTGGETSSPEPSGVWVVVTPGTGSGDEDTVHTVHAVYATELEALRLAVSLQVRACFLPVGMSLYVAVKAAIDRNWG